MIGNIRFALRAGVAALVIGATTSSVAASCADMLIESASGVGIHVRLSDVGEVEAIFSTGEGNFLAPKRSLINKARTAATLDAKRSFSAWLAEAVAGGTVASSLLEQVETTDQDGMTAGTASEITQIGESMASSTANVLSGLVKLDECVDTDEKYVLVELGWKPSLSEAAREVSSDLYNTDDAPRVDQQETNKTPIYPSAGYRKESVLKGDF